MVDGPWSLSVHTGEKKKLLAPSGIWTPKYLADNLVIIPITQFRLHPRIYNILGLWLSHIWFPTFVKELGLIPWSLTQFPGL